MKTVKRVKDKGWSIMMIDPRAGGFSSQQRQGATIDQLCYTWSTIGYSSSLAAGFRIRAASPGLQAINDDRVKRLDRYLRYRLPEGADRFEVQKNLEQAPICLALIKSELGEYILVHKKYVGQDGLGRLGNFFIHLLAGLPPDFSIKDAISLWRSPFWYVSEEGLGTSTQLNAFLLAELLHYRQYIDVMHPSGVDASQMQLYFPLFVSEYLTWRGRWQQWRASPSGEPPRLYIAAPPDMIAAFLYGLTICLPWQLLTDLTFSTYEDDIRKSQALLIGTCWLPNLQGCIDPTHDLPRECYNPDRGIALNCYRPPSAELKPQEDLNHHFVNYVAQCLRSEDITQLQKLVSNTGGMGRIDVGGFLNEYSDFIKDAFNLTPEKVETRLTSPDKAACMLGEPTLQEQINTWALSETSWCTTQLIPRLEKLSMQARSHPRLAEALQAYAVSVSNQVDKAVRLRQGNQFSVMLSVLNAVAPPKYTPEIWKDLLENLKQHLQKTLLFFSGNMHCYHEFLQLLGKMQLHVTLEHIAPILTVYWEDSENFFSLDFPLEWKRIAFLSQPFLTSASLYQEENKRNAIKEPGRYFENFVHALEELVITDHGWLKVEEVFVQLAKYGYPRKLSLLMTLLKSPRSAERQEQLVEKACLLLEEWKQLLQVYGPLCISSPLPETQSILWKKFSILVRAQPSWKEDILRSWLQPLSRPLASWLAKEPENLEFFLKKVSLALDDGRAFLDGYGTSFVEKYTRQDPQWFSPKKFPVLTAYIKDFVRNFQTEALGKSRFLSTLQTRLFAGLPENTRKKVAGLSFLETFFAQPSPTKLSRELVDALTWVSPREDLMLVEKLAEAFARCIEGETHLVLVINIFIDIMSDTPSLSKFYILGLIYSMIEQIRNSVENNNCKIDEHMKDKILAYMRFAFCLDDVYPDLSSLEYKHFLITFLDLLLQSTNEENLALLDVHLCHCEKWKKYKGWQFSKLMQPAKDGGFLQSSSQNRALVEGVLVANSPEEIHSQTDNGSFPETLFAQPSPTKLSLMNIAKTLTWASPREDFTLVERLAEAFVDCVKSETHLVLAINIMINVMSNSTSLFSKFDLLQLLYGMAEKIRDYGVNRWSGIGEDALQDLLLAYIRFALCLDDVYTYISPSEYNHFLITFLDLLLQCTDKENLIILDVQIRDSEKWDAYIKSRWTFASNDLNILQRRLQSGLPDNKPSDRMLGIPETGDAYYIKSGKYAKKATNTYFAQQICSTEQAKCSRGSNGDKPSVPQTKIVRGPWAVFHRVDEAWLKPLIDRLSRVNPIMKLRKMQTQQKKGRKSQFKQSEKKKS